MSGVTTVEFMPPGSPVGREALRGYFASVGATFYGHELSDEEVDGVMRDIQSADLEPPRGLLLVAHDEGDVLGCGGVHWLDDAIAEIKHLHVTAKARGQGLGERLMRELEQHARGAGCIALRLDTRSNLYAARRLYIRLGFAEIPRYNDNPYSQNWYEKPLS